MKFETTTIGKICTVGDGAHASIARVEIGVPYLTSKNFSKDGINLQQVEYISEQDYKKHFRNESKALTKPSESDLIFSIIGSIGGAYLYNDNDRFGLSSSVAIIRPNHAKVFPLFLLYYLKSPYLQKWVDAIKSGSAQGFLSLEMIRALPVIVPSLPIQVKISSILSDYDELIENNNQRIKLLEIMAEEIYQEWFVRMRFPGYETAKFIDGLPEGWKKIYFRDFIKLNRGFDLPDEKIIVGEYPVVASTSIKAFHNEYKVEAPCVVTGRSGSLGSVQYVNRKAWPLNTSLYVKDFKGNSPLFVYYFLRNMNLEMFNSGAGVPTLNQNHLHGVMLLLPNKIIQKNFDKILTPIFEVVELLVQKNQLLQQTRDLLLPRLLSGKLSVEHLVEEVVHLPMAAEPEVKYKEQ